MSSDQADIKQPDPFRVDRPLTPEQARIENERIEQETAEYYHGDEGR